MESSAVRVRFAPSPTGPLHMGGVRTALYNYLFAKKHGGRFILRIEDTDRKRFVPGAEAYILEALKWCGISPDEGVGAGGDFGPYRQSERKEMYAAYALQLVESGHAYYAFDSEDEIASCRQAAEAQKAVWQYDASTRGQMKNSTSLPESEWKALLDSDANWVIRFRMPAEEEVVFSDAIRGTVRVNTKQLDDKVLMKRDGMPTYHLANIVDDHLMEISHVIRGEEWLPSAPLHVLLYRAFGWEAPTFAHLSLILKPEGNGKLSKRDGDKGGFPVFPLRWIDPESGNESSGYRESGYLPEAFINMLLMLGWNPGTEQELFSHSEMIEAFSLDRVVKSGARFNPDKARWFNENYLRQQSVEVTAGQLKALCEAKGLLPDCAGAPADAYPTIVELMLERVAFVHEMTEARYFFEAPKAFHDKTVRKRWKDDSASRMLRLAEALEACNDFAAEGVEQVFQAFLEREEVGNGAVLPLFRLLLTGEAGGPSMFAIAAYLGKEKAVARIQNGVAKISA